MSNPLLAGSVVSLRGVATRDAAHWLAFSMECGSICGGDANEADLVVVPSDVATTQGNERARVITTDDLQSAISAHRPRELKGAQLPAPRRADALKGYRLALFGSFRNLDALTASALSLGAEIVAAPAIDADVAIFGRGLERIPQRLRRLRATGRSVRCFSELEYFDLVEPYFVPFRADHVQRALALRLLGLPDAEPSEFCVGF